MSAGVNWLEVLRPGARHLYARSQLDESSGDIHAEAPSSVEPWYAYGRFRIHEGQLQLAEVRVFNGSDRVGLEKKSRRWPDIGSVNSWSPVDELTTKVLRGLPMRVLRTIAIECVEKYGFGPLSDAERQAVEHRPGRTGKGDGFYAMWAARYVAKAGSRAPIAELAREHGLRREQVRDVIQQARERELLTAGRHGLLTAKAEIILGESSSWHR